MPWRCIFFFSALRAWSTLLSRTRTCTRAPFAVGSRELQASMAKSRCRLGVACSRSEPESPPERPITGHFTRQTKGSLGEDLGHVTHFAAGAHHGFAVKVHRGAGHGEEAPIILDLVPDEICHLRAAVADRFAEWPAGNRP